MRKNPFARKNSRRVYARSVFFAPTPSPDARAGAKADPGFRKQWRRDEAHGAPAKSGASAHAARYSLCEQNRHPNQLSHSHRLMPPSAAAFVGGPIPGGNLALSTPQQFGALFVSFAGPNTPAILCDALQPKPPSQAVN